MRTVLGVSAMVLAAVLGSGVAQAQTPGSQASTPEPPWAIPGSSPMMLRAPEMGGPAVPGPAGGLASAERLTRVIAHYAAQEEARRSTLRWVGLGMGGAALVVGGVSMSGSEPGDARYTGGIFALATGAGIGLGVLLGHLLETPADALVRAHRVGAAGGLQGSALVESTERTWHEIVERQRRQRRVAGYLLMGLGTLLSLGGAALLLAKPGDTRDARAASSISGALFFSVGATLVVGGGAVLHAHDTVEAGWEVWRMSQGAQ